MAYTKNNYANTDREMLSVFGCQRFHQYTYGRKVFVHSDHCSLSAINKKHWHLLLYALTYRQTRCQYVFHYVKVIFIELILLVFEKNGNYWQSRCQECFKVKRLFFTFKMDANTFYLKVEDKV